VTRRRERVLPELRDFQRAVHGRSEGHIPDREQRERIALRMLEPALECPQQRALLGQVQRNAKVATHKTRGGGATDVLGRYALGKMVLEDRWHVIVIVTTLASYTRNFLDRPGQESALTLLDQAGLTEWCRVERHGDAITRIKILPWGSELTVFDVDTARAIGKKRGTTARMWIIEEAQDVVLLDDVLAKLITPRKADFDARIVLNGTPSPEHDTLFAQASMGADPDWNVARLASWRNPFYGGTFADRWRRVVDKTLSDSKNQFGLDERDYQRVLALTEEDLDAIMTEPELPEHLAWVDDLDKDMLREIFGRWVGDAGKLVYNWHKMQTWADKPWADLMDVPGTMRAAVDALRAATGIAFWRSVGSYDFGCFPDPAAWVISAWAPSHPVSYELWSSKAHNMDDDDQLDVLARLLEAGRACGVQPSAAVGDLDMHSATTTDRWDRSLRARLSINLRRAHKPHRLEQIRAFNLAIGTGHYRCIRGSDLDLEGRHLRWHQRKRGIEDKTRAVRLADGRTEVLGDHCLDGGRYSLPYLPSIKIATPEELRALAEARAPDSDRDAQRLRGLGPASASARRRAS
jgi:hypothetical protein